MLRFEELYPDIYLLKVPFSGLWTGVVLVTGEENCLIDSGAKDTDVDQLILPALAELNLHPDQLPRPGTNLHRKSADHRRRTYL